MRLSRTRRLVVKSISGHRTDRTFSRYNILDEADLPDAVIKTTAFVKSLPATRQGGRSARPNTDRTRTNCTRECAETPRAAFAAPRQPNQLYRMSAGSGGRI